MGQKVKIFDPSRGAYFETDIETAKKFIESAKQAEKEIKKIEKEESK